MHEGLREYLKREVAPERVWAAIDQALSGQNESARVSASKLLLDALYEPAKENVHDHQAEVAAARAKLDEWLPRAVETVIRRLLITGAPDLVDPMIVHRTLELVQADERLAPFVERLAAERSAEEEIERRVAERTAEIQRERDEPRAMREEFAGSAAAAALTAGK